ncbi:MAG: hypothetical protein LBQ67_07095 [Treponema sp.]|jgi:hypothetical protein|nr:hypothetical protein [Treponema sp.]
MRTFKPGWSFFLTAAVIIFLGAAGGVFLLRPPVLVITDSSLSSLYGPVRAWFSSLESSLALGRRVIPVPVSENAAADIVTLAAGAASPSPYAVLFPYRYYDGGRRYKEEFPGVPVLILGAKEGELAAGTGLLPVYTDRETDFYRAGLCAALLAREGENGNILLFSDGTMPGKEREAFLEGLRAQGFIKNPVYLGLNGDYQNYQDVSCAVLAGPAVRFLAENRRIPVLLFSWIDPSMTPAEIKVIFDDSPWALAAGAVKAAEQGAEPGLLPSRPQVLRGRCGEDTRRALGGLVREERPR